MIVATAGHVDHGKTTLVKALTDVDTDRLPEEKARGLSVDLGFAYQALPDNTTLGFVDVPGHEKFVRNMLAGVAGIDLGLLVVAADDGIMPQTREHNTILNLLGIDQRVVAITKIDRVDAGRMLEVRAQIETLFESCGHQHVSVHPVCAPDNQGIEALKHTLQDQIHTLKCRKTDRHFRMAIDRVFTLKGTGLVVTGMVFAGGVNVGENLLLSSNGSTVRVRSIRALNQESDRAQAGERCAINIAGRGIGEDTVRRGDWLIHSSLYAPTKRIDVDLQVLASEPRSLKHWTPTHLHIGADHLTARVAVLSGGSIVAGENGLAQLVLDRDAFVVHGDRFVLRDQSAQRTIAGGRVIDPFSPKRGRARVSRLAILEAGKPDDPREGLEALTTLSEVGVPFSQFSVSHNLPEYATDAIIDDLALLRIGSRPQQLIFDAQQWKNFLSRVEDVVAKFHRTRPDSYGPNHHDILSALKPRVQTSGLNAALDQLIADNRLGQSGQRFHLPSHVVFISESNRNLWGRAAEKLAPPSGVPLTLHQAAEELGVDLRVLEKSLKNAVKVGEIVLVAKNRYVPTAFVARLGFAAERLANDAVDGFFTVADFRTRIEMGRNFTIDLLEYFDRMGFTERIGNNRRIKRPAAVVFSGNDERAQGRGSHPGGAPGLQIQ